MKIGMTAGVYNPDMAVFEQELKQLKSIGFDCIDYQGFVNTQTDLFLMEESEFDAYVRAHREIAERVGITVHQVHGPWRWPTVDDTKEGRAERFEKMTKAIRGTALLGCDRMVLHNLMPQKRIDTDPVFVREINKEFFTRLCAFSKDFGVTVCLENMPFPCQSLARPQQTLSLVKELGLESFRMCLDTGHAQVLNVTPGEAVRLIGKNYLYALHVHDNDGLRDRHWLIGDGVADWKDFGAALGEIGFDGCFSIESKIDPKLSPEERDSVLRRLYAKAKEIVTNNS
ncbi:MAG: sugar phosphate isomerase/epimerase [Clostridia bacterium]|nr:sugar phosphate isomerase/epimerase [Clostridia bacterium]